MNRSIAIFGLLSALAQYAVIIFFVLTLISPAYAQWDDQIRKRDSEVWHLGAPRCILALPQPGKPTVQTACPAGATCFPGEARPPPSDSPPPALPVCEDGDLTLFNALLCFSGDEGGCSAVASAQNDVTGEWFRSPRLRTYPRLIKENSFSPDMALGLQLWALLDPKIRRVNFQWWLNWLGRNQRCAGEGCTLRIPRFCPDDDVDGDPDAKLGCTMRPGDLATLSVVASSMNTTINDANFKNALRHWQSDAVMLAHSSAFTNDPDYPQHLAAVNILVLWQAGVRDPLLDKAAAHLASAQPQNPFFAWLAGKRSPEVAAMTLAKCPAGAADLPDEFNRYDWIWQRADDSDAWKHTMLWDCHFMAGVLLQNKSPKGGKK
ncbi:hypothetical protein [Paraburkholderia caledonica]|uniref:hypothetical protein n=1 Tax=Paraburkholderia caledonica TaxID=134536 RepID=UPI0013E08B24|nr:hypothetical protein [Paraburkholderia caledonica]